MDICHSISVKTRSKSNKLKTNWTKRKDFTSKNCILNIFCYVFSCINFELSLFLLRILDPTKMYIKSAPYWHQKSANWAYALVLMLLPKFFPNSTIRRCISGINLYSNEAKFAPNMMQICLK